MLKKTTGSIGVIQKLFLYGVIIMLFQYCVGTMFELLCLIFLNIMFTIIIEHVATIWNLFYYCKDKSLQVQVSLFPIIMVMIVIVNTTIINATIVIPCLHITIRYYHCHD